MEPNRTFAVASDEALVGLIARARNRLVVIAPALTQAVADALSHLSIGSGTGPRIGAHYSMPIYTRDRSTAAFAPSA